MADDENAPPPGGKPSLFMSAFQEIHERLAKEYGTDQEKTDGRGNKLHSGDVPRHFSKQIDTYWDFLKAIPWFEPWLILLMIFHFLCFVVIVTTRKHYNTQYVIFFFLLVLVYFSEKLNEYAAENWRLFANENYFDSNGLFTSTVLSAPILFNCLWLIAFWLHAAANTLINLKKQQIIQQHEKEKKSKIEHESKKSK